MVTRAAAAAVANRDETPYVSEGLRDRAARPAGGGVPALAGLAGLHCGRFLDHPPKSYRRPRGVARIVVVEDDVCLADRVGQILGPLGDFLQLTVGVVVIEPLGDRSPGDVAVRVAAVSAEIPELAIRHDVFRRHYHEMLAPGGVHRYQRDVAFLEEGDGVVLLVAGEPLAVPKLDRELPAFQQVDEMIQLVQRVLTRPE